MREEVIDNVVTVQNRYREWVLDGRGDAALGAALLHELTGHLAMLFSVPGELTILKQAKGGSGLEMTVLL